MATGITKLANLVNPEVMAPMIAATLPKKIKFTPFARVDTTLVGQPGDSITVPKFEYIGDAEDLQEGIAMGTTVLTATTTKATVKAAGKAVEITDKALLSGYGDPVGEAVGQLAMSVAAKVDNDCYEALCGATVKYNGSAAVISYNGIVDAVDLFEDESDDGLDKVIFVHPNQVTQLRKDPNFLDINKYPIANGVIMSGMIGAIAGCKVVKSKKVKLDTAGTSYLNPIVVVATDDPKEDPQADKGSNTAPALTIYMKRDANLEDDRDILKKSTVVSIDEHYTAVLSNDSKVVLASFKK
nr:MAG TPA: major capsid protein [Caudoviricetes sp.]